MNKDKLNNLASEIHTAIRDWQVREQEDECELDIIVEWIDAGSMDRPYRVIPSVMIRYEMESDL